MHEMYRSVAMRQMELARGEFDERGIVRDRDELGWCFVAWKRL